MLEVEDNTFIKGSSLHGTINFGGSGSPSEKLSSSTICDYCILVEVFSSAAFATFSLNLGYFGFIVSFFSNFLVDFRGSSLGVCLLLYTDLSL
jgi:hypothetical protein